MKYKSAMMFKRSVVLLLCSMLVLPVGLAEEIVRKSMVSETATSRFEQDLETRLTRDVKAYLNHEFFIIQVNALLENHETWDIKEVMVPVEPQPQAQQAPQPQPQPEPPRPQKPVQQQKETSVTETEERPSEQELLSQMELETEDGIDDSILEKTLGLEVPLPGIPVSQTVFDDERKKLTQERKQFLKEKRDFEKKKAELEAEEKARAEEEARKAAEPKPEPQQQTQQPPEPVMKKETVEKLLNKQEVIKKLAVKVMIDEHVSPEQEVFIRNLVIEKGELSFLRGDELKILRSVFPAASILDPPVEEEPAEEPALEEPPVDEATEEKPWWEEYWPYLAAAAAALLLLLLWLLLRRRTPEPVVETPVVEESEASKKIDELIQKMHEKVDTVNENRLEALREEVVSLSVTDQDMVSAQIVEWLSSGSEEDVDKSTILYKLLGEGLYRGLAKHSLTPEKQVGIAARAAEQDAEMSADERLALAENVFQTLMQRRYQQQHDMQNETRPFSFLEKLNDDQILYLLKEEALKVKALVMSQLSSERGASLLKRFNSGSRARIAMEISQFAKLPVSAFRDIANRLAKKAVHVPSYENLEVDGIDLLTDMLDHMNAAEETALLSSLQRDNPDLYYAIKQVYVSFDDIVRIPTLGLKNLIREMERDVLAMALYDTDGQFRDVIYDALLERPRAMLEATIRGLNSPDPDAIDDAKRKVSRHARAMLKAGAFKMPGEDDSDDNKEERQFA